MGFQATPTLGIKTQTRAIFTCGQTRKRTQLYPGYRHEIHNYDDIKVDVEASIVDWFMMQL